MQETFSKMREDLVLGTPQESFKNMGNIEPIKTSTGCDFWKKSKNIACDVTVGIRKIIFESWKKQRSSI